MSNLRSVCVEHPRRTCGYAGVSKAGPQPAELVGGGGYFRVEEEQR